MEVIDLHPRPVLLVGGDEVLVQRGLLVHVVGRPLLRWWRPRPADPGATRGGDRRSLEGHNRTRRSSPAPPGTPQAARAGVAATATPTGPRTPRSGTRAAPAGTS